MTTAQEVKQQFARHGLSIREWAAARGFSEGLVYAVLKGKNKATRGESFRIAVALGLRDAPPLDNAPQFVSEVLAHRSAAVSAHASMENAMT